VRRALVVGFLLGAFLALAVEAHATWRSKTCRFSGDVKRTIYCGVNHWAVPGGVSKALDVARCESGLDPLAYYNGNAGVFQQNLRYWPARHAAYNSAVGPLLDTGASVYNARSNVLVSIRMAHLWGWGAWSCA
jgi:hypothetical protein